MLSAASALGANRAARAKRRATVLARIRAGAMPRTHRPASFGDSLHLARAGRLFSSTRKNRPVEVEQGGGAFVPGGDAGRALRLRFRQLLDRRGRDLLRRRVERDATG